MVLRKIQKKLQRLFKEHDLEIRAETKQNILNYRNMILNLKDGQTF